MLYCIKEDNFQLLIPLLNTTFVLVLVKECYVRKALFEKRKRNHLYRLVTSFNTRKKHNLEQQLTKSLEALNYFKCR